MSKLSKLRGDAEKLVHGDTELMIKPLSFKQFTHVMELYDKKENTKALEYLIFNSMRKAIPSDGEEGIDDVGLQAEIDELDPRFVMKAVKVIQSVNGLSDISSEESKKE